MGLFGFGKKNDQNDGIAMPDFEQSMQKKQLHLTKYLYRLIRKTA